MVAINLGKNKIEDIRFLNTMNNLEELVLENNPIRDLNPLRSHENIRVLNLSDILAEDISPLGCITHLSTLVLSGVPVKELRPLLQNENLTELALSYTWIKDRDVLPKLKNLLKLQFRQELDRKDLQELRRSLPDTRIQIY
jgi:Leucine-rich repeat (LRR) protein